MSIQETLEPWLVKLQQIPYVKALLPDRVEPTPPANTWLGSRLDGVPRSVWVAVWPLALLAVWWLFLKGENDKPVRYRVPSPKLPDKDEFLSNPSIKVRRPRSSENNARAVANMQTDGRYPEPVLSDAMLLPPANSSASSTPRHPLLSIEPLTPPRLLKRHGPTRAFERGGACCAPCYNTFSTTRTTFAVSPASTRERPWSMLSWARS